MSWLDSAGYDNWKTACCGNYPNCTPCPYNDDEEEEDDLVVTYSLDVLIKGGKDEYEELTKIRKILGDNGYPVENWEIETSTKAENYY